MITLVIVVLTTVISIAAFSNASLFSSLLFEPFVIKARGQWYRFITHAFIHANWPHLLVNMFVLYVFGRNVEPLLGLITGGSSALPFLALYVGGVLFSTLPSYRRHIHDPNYRAVGASGAVSAILFAQVVMLPTMPLQFMFFPRPVPAWVFGVLYLVYSWYMDKRGGDNVAHDAHLYGALFGVVFMFILDPGLLLSIGGFQHSLGL
ncbi:MAG: rhomboid family intramembrane serine protease [Flavobacteriales bacterium]|nr:rhomboid family intramembrane serine protease [Flavobacteriales bacterium]MCC6939375.1 rhomboid family intramembrane serine protease [Flavobacteriales bacterium]